MGFGPSHLDTLFADLRIIFDGGTRVLRPYFAEPSLILLADASRTTPSLAKDFFLHGETGVAAVSFEVYSISIEGVLFWLYRHCFVMHQARLQPGCYSQDVAPGVRSLLVVRFRLRRIRFRTSRNSTRTCSR
jgi:hypothetical protein